MWADNEEVDQNTVATKCRCCVYTDGNYTSRRNRFYSSFSAAAQIFVMLFIISGISTFHEDIEKRQKQSWVLIYFEDFKCC